MNIRPPTTAMITTTFWKINIAFLETKQILILIKLATRHHHCLDQMITINYSLVFCFVVKQFFYCYHSRWWASDLSRSKTWNSFKKYSNTVVRWVTRDRCRQLHCIASHRRACIRAIRYRTNLCILMNNNVCSFVNCIRFTRWTF